MSAMDGQFLPNVFVIQDKHRDVLKTACDEVINLISNGLEQHTSFPEDMTILDPASKHHMDIYIDEID